MKSYDKLKSEIEEIQKQMVEANKNDRTKAPIEVKRLCEEFGSTVGMLKISLGQGEKK